MSENLTLTSSQRRRIEAAEMKLLRPLAGYTLCDHKTNDYIGRQLQITGTLDKTDEYRRNLLSHLQRMLQKRIPLKSYHYRPQGRRTIGRPKKRWREQLQLWRHNGSKGPVLDVYDDDYNDIFHDGVAVKLLNNDFTSCFIHILLMYFLPEDDSKTVDTC